MSSQSLVIDAATNVFQVGILEKDHFAEYYYSHDNTLIEFFSLLRSVFKPNFQEIIFCRGPGKLIGIRATLMFVRILKIMQPAIKIYAYDALSFAYGVLKRNISGEIVQKKSENRSEEELVLPHRILNDSVIENHFLPNDMVCLRKNSTQYYLYQNGKIALVQRNELGQRAIYCVLTRQGEECDSPLIPMEYYLKDNGEVIRENMSPNNTIATEFDPENNYKQWKSIRHH
ncbi:MAG: hypothetical protein LBJ13_00075 [Puniceicoccales bacterium]|jgi:hypothetical protein|nr:hypothetical protein [Puniceicoccales bacterium]